MNFGNLHQKASTWVTFSVLGGGMLTALILVFIYRVQNDFEKYSVETKIVNIEQGL